MFLRPPSDATDPAKAAFLMKPSGGGAQKKVNYYLVFRCKFPHVFCLALCSSLVQSLEREVVWRVLPDHLSASHPPVDRPAVECGRIENGLHAGAVAGCPAAAGRSFSLCQNLGR